MRCSLLFTLFYLFVAAWAGGYQGCLERVWLYQAYLIDSLNDYNDQTIGWQCKDKGITKRTTTCSSWVRMPGSSSGSTLSYDQFIFNLGRVGDRTGWSVMSGGKLDLEATALNTYNKYLTPRPGQAPGTAKVKNFGAHLAVKGTFEWNACIMKVGEVVDRTYRDKSAGMDDATKKLFKDFDMMRELVIKARAADHAPFLINEARQKLCVDPNKKWETVDWTATEKAALEAGDKDAGKKIRKFLGDWYSGNKDARDHDQVINSFKHQRDQQLACGR
ncbi:hypothetical protein COCC4DRAFT_59515 [Bipolaris maydis ATCC 48331]|uniref:Uncharacterized protein n=1 Tax=Cochliobolus heterostrophus (strain C4 / ATCC 48331 / race T) TaxID=665024 RepID=N4XJZ6_COCH4|nr:uncharacterized protein COCC4DRAFT_59515 [Bipolaris maydis ATCC 48331]ENI06851.1 hypothetical protein COCC4DRAFT_59515 [Bipolaris maydis ATCC 48331]